MSNLKIITLSVDLAQLSANSSVNSATLQEQAVVSTALLAGPRGPTGPAGANGPAGVGMPTGGSAGQFLRKVSGADYDFEFGDFPPALVTNTFVVDNEAEMLALVADQGDVAVRTDLNSNFILRGTDPTDIDDWQELLGGVGNVASVNGHTGVVVLDKTDVGLPNVDNTSDNAKPISAAVAAALATKQGLDSDLTAIAGLSPSNNDFMQRKAGAWTNRTPAQAKSDLALTAADVGLSNVPDVDATERANHTGTQLAATISDLAAAVQTNRLDQMAAPNAAVAMNGQLITGLADPISNQDAVTKAYVDAISMGLYIKSPVRAATTANIDLNSPGAAIDGVTLASNDRVLVKDQSTPSQNGIWVFNGAASAMTRALDANVSAEVKAGTYTFVSEGSTQADTSWVLTTDDPITLGSTGLTFTNFGTSTTPDATTLLKGKLKLAGDLGGTSDNPLVKGKTRFTVAAYGSSRAADFKATAPNVDAAQVIAARNAAAALPRGGIVELLDDNFIFEQAVLRVPDVYFIGQGIKHTKVDVVVGASFTAFDMDKVTYNETNPLENSIIADMEISGENLDPASEKKAINGGNFKDCHIYRVWAHDTTATGIGDDDFYGTTIEQCLVSNCGYQNKRTIIAASWSGNVFTFETSAAHGYTAWVAATGTLTSTGAISNNETVVIGGVIYTFKTTLTGAAFEVLIGGSAAAALTNLKAAINLTGTIGVDYGTGTTKHPTVGAGTLTATTLAMTANTIGTGGNSITTTETGANIAFGGGTLSGGVAGSKIVIAGMLPSLYNGTFNVTTIPDGTHFTISSSTNSTGLNFTINPGVPTQYGCSSDSILGHNGIGIASGALGSEACIVSNCVCIGNQNNNFLIEADNNNSLGNEVYIFSNCISINAGSCGFRNTGSLNAQFNNCYDYGSPIGGQAISTYQSKAITGMSWSGGIVTADVSTAYLFAVGDKITISGMVPDAYNGWYTVLSTPISTQFTFALASDPGTAVHFGTCLFEAHPVDGSSFNHPIFVKNLDYGLLLPDEGVTVAGPVIKDCYNYGARLNSASNCRLEEVRIYGSGRQGVSIIMGGGVYAPMDHVKITGHVYNNGQRFANCDGIDVDPSVNSAAIQNLEIDVHAFDNQDTKTQRYGVILRSGGTLTNIHVKGNLYGNATAPILVQNTSDTIYITDVIGVNPNGKKTMGNISGSTSFDPSVANLFIGTLTGNLTAVMPTPPMGGVRMTWILVQDGTGSRTLTLPANATSGPTLTLSTAAAAVDIINWAYDSIGGKWRVIGVRLGHTPTVPEGGTGVATLTGLVKGNGTAAFSAAAAGTDYYAPGGTDVAVADGGTGASSAANARTNLGLVIGTNVQAYDPDLDTWATKTAPVGTPVGDTDTQTLTNKRVTPRTNTTASSATPTINTDTTDFFTITALAAAITSMTTNLSGTPTAGQRLLIRIKDNGTARAITWGASFGNSGIASLPATTVISKTHHVLLVWDEAAALWVCLAADTIGY